MVAVIVVVAGLLMLLDATLFVCAVTERRDSLTAARRECERWLNARRAAVCPEAYAPQFPYRSGERFVERDDSEPLRRSVYYR